MRFGTLSLLSLFVACGGSGNPAAFIGTYSNTGTNSWTDCGSPPTAESGTTTLTIVAGPSGNEITTQQQGCNLNWTIDGDKASLIAGQVCTGVTNGFNWTLTYTSGTSTLSGTTLTGSLTGSQVFTGSTGTETCTLSQGGLATRTSN